MSKPYHIKWIAAEYTPNLVAFDHFILIPVLEAQAREIGKETEGSERKGGCRERMQEWGGGGGLFDKLTKH